MKKRIYIVISQLESILTITSLLAVLVFILGCAHYQVRIPDSDPLEKQYQGGIMHSFFWGAYIKPEIMAAECQGEAINDVVIKNNFFYDFAGVVTLGIWMPLEVEYRCRAPDISDGSFPE